jgi:lipoic acid synthetase
MPDSAVQSRTSATSAGGLTRPALRLPEHCKSPARPSSAVFEMKRMLRRRGLHSVCEEARCPNLAECFARGTVTFMLLGDVCTRACRFCHVATGLGRPVDPREPEQVAAAARELRLRHVVLTSVNRDDLEDQGSTQFARTVAALRRLAPGASVEVLTPDFRGDPDCIDRVADARPEVYNHNLETVPSLYREVRIGARYDRSLALLARVKARRAETLTKSGLMLGLGETRDELVAVFRALRDVQVDCLTLGQYLRPTLRHRPVTRYLEPAEFAELGGAARALGFRHVESGPLVRSSFHADTALNLLSPLRGPA